ncbi:MAG: hypothetical protein E7675_05670 [Ruminococcaceae bacterium]|nr:hypothetical protein [Oscillospiraceae bacterium]
MKIKTIIPIIFLLFTLTALCSCNRENIDQPSSPAPEGSITCCDADITDFVIVLPTNHTAVEENIAYFLKNHLYKSFGYSLDIVSDEDEHQYEILIGDTPGSESIKEAGKYSVIIKNGKLQLFASDPRGYEGLYDYIKNELFNKEAKLPIALECGIRISRKTEGSMENGTLLSNTAYGNIRVAYYNVYSGSNNSATPDVRQPFQKEIIRTYDPNVIGFQEFSGKYHDDFAPMLEDLGYTMIKTSRGRSNCTPIFYKSDKLELIDSGHYLYKDTGDYSKSISWGVFREINTQKVFAFFNTHFMFRREGVDANEIRISNATEALGEFIKVQNEYPDIPMLLGGDFNCRISSDPHNVLTNGGLLSAWELAENKNNSKGHHMFSTYDKELRIFTKWSDITTPYSTAIDHAYVSKTTKVKTFSTVISYYTLWCSDHMPLMVEIDL